MLWTDSVCEKRLPRFKNLLDYCSSIRKLEKHVSNFCGGNDIFCVDQRGIAKVSIYKC